MVMGPRIASDCRLNRRASQSCKGGGTCAGNRVVLPGGPMPLSSRSATAVGNNSIGPAYHSTKASATRLGIVAHVLPVASRRHIPSGVAFEPVERAGGSRKGAGARASGRMLGAYQYATETRMRYAAILSSVAVAWAFVAAQAKRAWAAVSRAPSLQCTHSSAHSPPALYTRRICAWARRTCERAPRTYEWARRTCE